MPNCRTMRKILAGVLLLYCVGCAGPTFVTRPVQDDPSVLVGLASYHDPEKGALVWHDHPREWSEAELSAILTRLRVQERGGLMDPTRPPRAVFSSEDMTHLLPGLRKSFRKASHSDWVVFALSSSPRRPQGLEVTSGGMFLKDQAFHVILANDRERISSKPDAVNAIHRNPLHPLRDVKGTLTFTPATYVIDSRTNWLAGSFESPVNEIVLDHKAFLAAAGSDQVRSRSKVTP